MEHLGDMPCRSAIRMMCASPATSSSPAESEKGPTSSLFTAVKECSTTVARTFQTPLDGICQVASNPDAVTLPSEVKSTCKYPVDDVYTLLEVTEPDSRAICSVELHDDDEQRLIVT